MSMRNWVKPIPVVTLLVLVFVIWLAYASMPMTYQRVKILVNMPFMWGVVSFVGLYIMILKKSDNFRFLTTKDHELVHTFFALLFFKKMHEFVATSHQGGYIRYTGSRLGNTIITLSPYVIRIPLILAVFIGGWILSIQPNKWVYFMVGFTFAYAYVVIYSESHRHQTDLQETGLIHSYLSIIASHILMLGVLSSFVLPNASVIFFIKTVLKKALFL